MKQRCTMKQMIQLNDDNTYKEINVIEIPDEVTNGDMIKKIFPNAEYLICEDVVNVTFCDTEANWFDKEWWNAPYKEN